MATFKLTLEYDGRGFAGWQSQRERERTVQGELLRALAEIAPPPIRLMGAGRTDAGVHAEGQVASVTLETRLDGETLRRALNAKLPEDIAVLAAEPRPDAFDARRDAIAKRYRYQLWNAELPSPLRAARFWHVREPLDLAALRAGAARLVGTHDFTSFRGAGSAVRTSTRTLTRVDVWAEGGGVMLGFEGEGFLRHMVRIAVGTLVEVGLGRRPAAWMAEVLAARDRAAAGRTAPACGLTLEWVRYPGDEAETSAGSPV
ncbi:MAG: tRNA pseudouridine(38-40) synthase TruA [Deltaproteobacteria bacterium]|nr:tRNA pseudouridine(38-40) synthase TruA [Deltaproteobacteria bacterium]